MNLYRIEKGPDGRLEWFSCGGSAIFARAMLEGNRQLNARIRERNNETARKLCHKLNCEFSSRRAGKSERIRRLTGNKPYTEEQLRNAPLTWTGRYVRTMGFDLGEPDTSSVCLMMGILPEEMRPRWVVPIVFKEIESDFVRAMREQHAAMRARHEAAYEAELVRLSQPEHRMLIEGEIIQQGDEWRICPENDWNLVRASIGCKTGFNDVGDFRRRIARTLTH